MPFLGADMEAGTVVEWLVKPGDRVARGDVVALVETEKGLIEVEIFTAGVVDTIAVEPGAKVPVGTLLALIDESPAGREAPRPRPEAAATAPAERAPEPPPTAAAPPAASAGAEAAPGPAAATPPPGPRLPAASPERPRVSPLARRMAAELGVDLAHVTGTGEGGAIVKADIERAAAGRGEASPEQSMPAVPPAAEPGGAAVDRLAAMRRAIAAAMTRSKREIPHYYLGTEVDMSRCVAWLAGENAKRPVTSRLLHSALLLKAVALAAREIPEMNGHWIEGGFRPADAVHLGVGISLRQGGLVAPAIHDVEGKTVDEVMRDLLDLVKRARAGVLRSSEVSDATLTVTNLGDQGVESVFGIIYPPQVALVGIGRLHEKPWAEGGMIGARPVVAASLSADHRASDGHRGARFLTAIARRLQAPEML